MATFVTAKMLNKMRKKYMHVDLAVREIESALSEYKDLKPAMDTYVFNDGSSKELIALQGTIPVTYRGNMYNIPVCLWLLDSFPYNPPIPFVKPTSAMVIKAGKHIDANGKIYLPYLHEWAYPKSDLYGLIQVLVVAFGEEPPVFSRPSTQTPFLTTVLPSIGQSPAPKQQNPMVGTGSSMMRNQGACEPASSTEFKECNSSVPERSPAVVSAPEMPTPSLASLCLSGTAAAASEESVLMREKLELEIDVLQKQKKLLEIQEKYYAFKLSRLTEGDASQ